MSAVAIEPGAEFPVAHHDLGTATAGYLVVIERADRSVGAYVPDLPGVVAAADSEEEVMALIAEAIQFHLEGLAEDGLEVPPPTSHAWRS